MEKSFFKQQLNPIMPVSQHPSPTPETADVEVVTPDATVAEVAVASGAVAEVAIANGVAEPPSQAPLARVESVAEVSPVETPSVETPSAEVPPSDLATIPDAPPDPVETPAPAAPPKAPKLTREDEAKLALENTRFSWGAAHFLFLFFLVTIVAPPAYQFWAWYSGHPAPRRTPAMEARPADYRHLPQAFDVLALWPTQEEINRVKNWQDAWALLPPTEEFTEYEDNLKKQSLVSEWLLPRTQEVLTGIFDTGSEQVYAGAPGWLFYRPDIDYLTGTGFRDPQWLKTLSQREAPSSGDQVTIGPSELMQPDPLLAIEHFHKQLKERGIELVVMPVPPKATIHPEMLALGFQGYEAPQNPSYRQFIHDLRERGIAVFDPTSTLLETKQKTGRRQYLPADTHWTPEAMERVSMRLTQMIRARFLLPKRKPFGYVRRKHRVRNISDIAALLKLPNDSILYPRQEVDVWRVYDKQGRTWKSLRKADIMFLGDSFSNIYSRGGHWGESAGLVEQVSYYLQRPISRLTVDGGGASETRRQLASLMETPPGPLANKRLVIYQFAARALYNNDWKLIDLPKPSAAEVLGLPVPEEKKKPLLLPGLPQPKSQRLQLFKPKPQPSPAPRVQPQRPPPSQRQWRPLRRDAR